MASGESDKTKLPRTILDVQAMEDRLDRIRRVFQQIREHMAENKIETVDLAWATSGFMMDQLMGMAEKYNTEARKQIREEAKRREREGRKS